MVPAHGQALVGRQSFARKELVTALITIGTAESTDPLAVSIRGGRDVLRPRHAVIGSKRGDGDRQELPPKGVRVEGEKIGAAFGDEVTDVEATVSEEVPFNERRAIIEGVEAEQIRLKLEEPGVRPAGHEAAVCAEDRRQGDQIAEQRGQAQLMVLRVGQHREEPRQAANAQLKEEGRELATEVERQVRESFVLDREIAALVLDLVLEGGVAAEKSAKGAVHKLLKRRQVAPTNGRLTTDARLQPRQRRVVDRGLVHEELEGRRGGRGEERPKRGPRTPDGLETMGHFDGTRLQRNVAHAEVAGISGDARQVVLEKADFTLARALDDVDLLILVTEDVHALKLIVQLLVLLRLRRHSAREPHTQGLGSDIVDEAGQRREDGIREEKAAERHVVLQVLRAAVLPDGNRPRILHQPVEDPGSAVVTRDHARAQNEVRLRRGRGTKANR